MDTLLETGIESVARLFPDGTMLSYPFSVRATLALIVISLTCGAVGSLVVGNRLAFFSDALAHSAFAGVAIGIIISILARWPLDDLLTWAVWVMTVFGIVTGWAIVFVREKTAQSNDTVIGVFFAGAVGLGAIFMTMASRVRYFPTDEFLFGNLYAVSSTSLIALMVLVIVTAGLLMWMYNGLVFANFNTSLARSRRIPLRFYNYLFIGLLAVIVNLCLSAVGALLINALLVVPAATAVNLCRNMRQLFRWSIIICLVTCLAGQWLSWELVFTIHTQGTNTVEAHPGESGTIVVLSVLLFFLSMVIGPWLRNRPLPSERMQQTLA